MASRVTLPQQNKTEGVSGGLKQKNMAIEGRNRRALGDIGNICCSCYKGVSGGLKQKNMAIEGRNRRALGDIGNIAARVTRTSQLLGNAPKETATDNNNKKCIVANVNGAQLADGIIPQVKGVAARRQIQKKTTFKPNPEEVIVISSDSEEEEVKKTEKRLSKKAGELSSRKKAPTLTSTLTARSKAVCELSLKPKVQIVDIDVADKDNELAVTEYVDDMYKFYKMAEIESRVHDYMHSQKEINEKMRAILIDWLVEVHIKFELNRETLYLTHNIIDRYLAVKQITRKELQLLGLGAMLIASKYEEIWAPEVSDLVNISAQAYTHEQVLVMEKRILGVLEWYLTVPTPYVFVVRFTKASIPDSNMENMVYFLSELAMMHYSTIIYCPSMVAASAVYAARCTLNKSPFWDDTLNFHTGFSEAQIMDCAKLLVNYHSMAADHNLKVIYKKYSSKKLGGVALLPAAKFLLAEPSS